MNAVQGRGPSCACLAVEGGVGYVCVEVNAPQELRRHVSYGHRVDSKCARRRAAFYQCVLRVAEGDCSQIARGYLHWVGHLNHNAYARFGAHGVGVREVDLVV